MIEGAEGQRCTAQGGGGAPWAVDVTLRIEGERGSPDPLGREGAPGRAAELPRDVQRRIAEWLLWCPRLRPRDRPATMAQRPARVKSICSCRGRFVPMRRRRDGQGTERPSTDLRAGRRARPVQRHHGPATDQARRSRLRPGAEDAPVRLAKLQRVAATEAAMAAEGQGRDSEDGGTAIGESLAPGRGGERPGRQAPTADATPSCGFRIL